MIWIGKVAAFMAAVPQGTSLLAIDLGARSLGLAGSDISRRLATPLKTLPRSRFHRDAPALERIIAAREVGGLVLGWPLQMDDTEGPRCQATRAYADNLHARFGLPILLFDERLSSFAAEDIAMMGDRLGRGRKHGRGRQDHVAAAVILQDALDAWSAERARDSAALSN